MIPMSFSPRARTVFAESSALQALAIGLAASLTAWLLWQTAPAAFTTWEWSPYDAWLRFRASVPASRSIVLIARDRASEERFGTGPWDRALIAKLVTALHDAGAAVIGVELPITAPSPPHLGGAVSDALLAEATKEAGTVVYPLTFLPAADSSLPAEAQAVGVASWTHTSWPTITPDIAIQLPTGPRLLDAMPPLAQQAYAVGHLLALPNGDRIVRQVPLYLSMGDRAIPAFGLALATAFYRDRVEISLAGSTTQQLEALGIPARSVSRLFVNYAGDGRTSSFSSLSFATLVDAVDLGDRERLAGWVDGKVVLLLPNSSGEPLGTTPTGYPITPGLIHAHVLHTLLTRQWVGPVSSLWQMILSLALSSLAARTLLSLKGWKGLLTVSGLMLGYGALLLMMLAAWGWLLPLVVPFSATLLVFSGITVWSHVSAGQCFRLVEQEMRRIQQESVAVREALIRRENVVERLEEDLEAARAAIAQSTGRQAELAKASDALRVELAEARSQEAAARKRLHELEREWSDLQAVESDRSRLSDAEQERLRQECEQLGIITRHPVVLGLFRDLKKGARSSLSILLLGEPGTGKELFARAVHQLSSRAGKPFIAVNMAALSPDLFESEMFGHVRGSFTGATSERKGYFELAHQGTLFLDEIGDLRLDHQGKLLRALQDQTFYRVGATTLTSVDVRIVTATNKDLVRGASEGWFREDLYFRLKGLVLRLPPLRERLDDVPLLADHYLHTAAAQAGREGMRLSREALAALQRHEWKGNIRELRHCLEQAVALAEGPVITEADLRLAVEEAWSPGREHAFDRSADEPLTDAAVLAGLRRQGFDMQATAKALKCDRSTVTQRLKGLGFQALVDAGGDQTKAALALAGDPALTRTVELKLADYYGHLIKTIEQFRSAEEALFDCQRRFKNLPDRHFRAVETLIRWHFAQTPASVKTHGA
jgi:DNA-binding NtrC family response regulator/CHASE2 domain-containing sensor protein